MSKASKAIRAIEEREEKKKTLSKLPSLVGRSLHQTEVDCPHWGHLREMLCLPTVCLTADCMSHSALAGILVAQRGDSARTGQGLAGMYIFEKSRWGEM